MVATKAKVKTPAKTKPKVASKSNLKTKSKTTVTKNKDLFEMFAENFNGALDAAGYPSLHYGRQVAVHKDFNISTSAARKWVVGDCLPDLPNLLLIADRLNISLDALFGRTPRLSSEPMVSIPIGDMNPSKKQKINQKASMQMEASWVDNGMRMKHDKLFLMMISGENMAPTLLDGDYIFVDSTPIENIRDVKENGIYLIMAHGKPQIRRLTINYDDTVTLSSDNKSYQSVQLPIASFSVSVKDESAPLKIVGEIPWAIKRVSTHSHG